MRLLDIITERFYGAAVTAFHQTNSIESAKSILLHGFSPGKGETYSRGLYTVHNLATSKNLLSRTYGNVLIKFRIKLIKFFVFDWNVLKSEQFSTYRKDVETYVSKKHKIHAKLNETNFIKYQSIYFNINVPDIGDPTDYKFSSDIVEKYLQYTNNKFNKYVNGAIYTRDSDGEVIVVYNTTLAIPIAIKVLYKPSDVIDDNWQKIPFDSDKDKLDALKRAFRREFPGLTGSKKLSPADYGGTLNNGRWDFRSLDSTILSKFIKDGKFTVKFGIIRGDVQASNLGLVSLENGPVYVSGSYTVSRNKLKSLKGSPRFVGAKFDCSRNPDLESLVGSPERADSGFICDMTGIINLKGSPTMVHTFSCIGCHSLISLEGGPKYAKNFYCYGGSVKFTEADVRKYTNVRENISV